MACRSSPLDTPYPPPSRGPLGWPSLSPGATRALLGNPATAGQSTRWRPGAQPLLADVTRPVKRNSGAGRPAAGGVDAIRQPAYAWNRWGDVLLTSAAHRRKTMPVRCISNRQPLLKLG